jgi:hypothetical protein
MASRKLRDFRRWAAAVLLPAFLTLNIAVAAQDLSETTLPGADATALVTPSVSVFHFTDGGDDSAGRMTTDAAGNFYVAATLNTFSQPSAFAVLKYRFNGTLQGAFRYKLAPGDFGGLAREVKVDKLGNIYAVGDTFLGGRVVSFTSTGSQRWSNRFCDSAIALAIDAAGNVYAAGTRATGNFQSEWVIVKYNGTGQLLWTRHHTGTVLGDVRLTDIQLDPAGNPVVTGTTNLVPSVNGDTMTTMKLDSLGSTLWVRDFVANPAEHHVPLGLAVDRTGSVYVTGIPGPNDGGSAPPFTVKYDANGNRKFVLPAGGLSVAVDPAGDILLAGASPSGGPTFIAASKFHATGTKVWVTQIAAALKIGSDAAGNVFVAGSVFNNDSTNPSDYLITKLSPAGKLVFQTRFNRGDDISDATVDPFGNLLVTGNGINAQFQNDIFTIRVK